MKLKLTPDDRKAIDLLLGETAAASQATSRGYVGTAGPPHIQAVRTALEFLAVMPAPEPSADLVSRTLAHISQATGQPMAASPWLESREHRAQPMA